MGFFDFLIPKRKPTPPVLVTPSPAPTPVIHAPVIPIVPEPEALFSFVGAAASLTEEDIVAAARVLGCSVAAVKAVVEVEAAGAGFLKDGRPKILFESHIFGRLTNHRYEKHDPNISTRKWDRSTYGPSGAHQYSRLERAMKLDPDAALKSPSWGAFQILGQNHAMCGYATVQEFVAAMTESEGHHLLAFVRFCQSSGLDNSLRKLDWARFARGYNGPGYAQNRYDVKLAAAYKKHGGK